MILYHYICDDGDDGDDDDDGDDGDDGDGGDDEDVVLYRAVTPCYLL